MRKLLRRRENERTTFRGTFDRFGKKRGWHGREETTVLLKNIVDANGNPICDHLWFNLTQEFRCLNLEPGDLVQFDARVKSYFKGYQGWRDDIEDRPVEIDYKLSYPTRLSKAHPSLPRI